MYPAIVLRPFFCEQEGSDATVDDAQHPAHDGWAAREQETQRITETERMPNLGGVGFRDGWGKSKKCKGFPKPNSEPGPNWKICRAGICLSLWMIRQIAMHRWHDKRLSQHIDDQGPHPETVWTRPPSKYQPGCKSSLVGDLVVDGSSTSETIYGMPSQSCSPVARSLRR